MKPRPGTLLWLVANDVRNNWRMLGDVLTTWPISWRIALAIAVVTLLHFGAFGCFVLTRRLGYTGDTGIALATLVAGGLWMTSQGLLSATRALYQRGELELLLTSPIAPWKPVAARAVSIASSSLGSLAAFFIPAANAGAWLHGTQWLAIYPIAVSLALAGTAIGFVIAVTLFYLVGPFRARLAAQIAAAVIAGFFVLGVQVLAIIPDHLAADLGAILASSAAFPPDIGLVQAATRLVTGDPMLLAVAVSCSVALFLGCLALASPAFVSAATIAAGTADASRRARAQPFRQGPLTALRLKETRLLIRDPNLFAQLGLQIVYTLPLAVILIKNPSNIPPAVALLPLVVVLASQVAASLSWLTISGEDAPELIATAPLPAGWPEAAKLTAIAVPLSLILAIPAGALMMAAPEALPYAIVFGAMAAASTALLNFWHPMPGNRRGMLRRHHQAKIVAVAEHGLTLLWAVATMAAYLGGIAAVVPMALIVLLLWCFKPAANRSVLRHRQGPTAPPLTADVPTN